MTGPFILWCQQIAPDLPPHAWWLMALTLIVLGLAAAIDAVMGIVPDALVALGLTGLLAGFGLTLSWPVAAHHLLWGLGAALLLWAVNEIWYRRFKHDAFGMGDTKWSVLAVTGLGPLPVLMGWGGGACLAVLWLTGLRLAKQPVRQVHFAPFLFLGLLGGLYWLHR